LRPLLFFFGFFFFYFFFFFFFFFIFFGFFVVFVICFWCIFFFDCLLSAVALCFFFGYYFVSGVHVGFCAVKVKPFQCASTDSRFLQPVRNIHVGSFSISFLIFLSLVFFLTAI